jgi:hypothetical protein
MRNRLLALRAEDEPNRRVLVGSGPVFRGILKVEVHLANIGPRKKEPSSISIRTGDRSRRERVAPAGTDLRRPQPLYILDNFEQEGFSRRIGPRTAI